MDLWTFAIETYGQDGISADCLRVQDTLDIDVPLLLWAAWAAVSGHVVDAATLNAADALASPWRDQVVRPLRAVRRQLKQGPAPAPCPVTEALRDKVKAAELSAEKIQLDTLATLTLRPGVADPITALRRTADRFASRDLTPDEDAILARLAAAAERVLPPA
ncbi:TIGR02444 family protein [Puniceibacterium sp. IMCC21224]|uniref:TIGR02444 family protein n=1 Tax=Puniceibacterium sp. IMCC21224 TaxID=1618204 RepID=UPI00064E096E|nr:TIGR02444 family protein [Puniceibacterium sp. IMCC21224]KMK68498.1 TIGR02444 family protein [Puniceibacterium sp. IMCC21224]